MSGTNSEDRQRYDGRKKLGNICRFIISRSSTIALEYVVAGSASGTMTNSSNSTARMSLCHYTKATRRSRAHSGTRLRSPMYLALDSIER